MSLFKSRSEAGIKLADELSSLNDIEVDVVVALPRGGVPVAYPLAERFSSPLDILVVRKLGMPRYREMAMGAIASTDVLVLNSKIIDTVGIDETQIESELNREKKELRRREITYDLEQCAVEIQGQSVVVVDDGLVTGASMRAAVSALRLKQPRSINVAVPVGTRRMCARLEKEVERVICLYKPDPFVSVGFYYHDFSQTTDEEVCLLLRKAAKFNGSCSI